MGVINKKITALASALIITAMSNVCLAYTPIGQDYHTPTPREELEDTYNRYFDKVKKEHHNEMEKSVFLESIRDNLIRYNSNKLKKATGKYDDGLRDVFVTDKGMRTSKEGGEEFAGFVTIEAPVLYYVSDNPTKDYNIYAHSTIANTYAHEASHWYYGDGWVTAEQKTSSDKDDIKVEIRADALAIKLIDNVPTYSAGGALSDAYYMAYEDGWYNESLTHPDNISRYEVAYSFIKESSNERVIFDNDLKNSNELLVADKKKTAYYTVYPQEQVLNGEKVASAFDRANYIAGQIAWAIKNNCYDEKHITYEDAHKYFSDLPTDVSATAIIVKNNSGKWKIIDWYQTDKAETTEKQFLDNLKASYK